MSRNFCEFYLKSVANLEDDNVPWWEQEYKQWKLNFYFKQR